MTEFHNIVNFARSHIRISGRCLEFALAMIAVRLLPIVIILDKGQRALDVNILCH